MSPKFLSLQCISAAVENEEDLYAYSEASEPLYSNYSIIPPVYSNYPSMPPSTRRSPSCSSGISSGSDPEYDSVVPGTGMRYNVKSEGVFHYSYSSCIHKEETGGRECGECVECGHKGGARGTRHTHHADTLHDHVLHHPHDGPDSTACPHEEAGCEWRGSGRNLRNHVEKNVGLHLQMMVAHTKRQAEYIAALQTKIEDVSSSRDGTLVWRISNFSKKMLESKNKEGLELLSRPFFTSHTGYKLQASLFLNGNGGGENTHLSLYIKVLPGEHDCILKWPFRHTISFTLLDQNMDRRAAVNVMESFVPDQNWPNFNKPSTCNDQDQLGFGFPKFVHQDILTKRGYVTDDTLFIKIRADPKKGVCV